MFRGKGIFTWQIRTCGGPDGVVETSKKLKLDYNMIKVADGNGSYNLRENALGLWVDDIVGPTVEGLEAAGIKPIGWQYVYLYNPIAEARKAAERVKKFNLKAFVVNAENQAKDKPGQAAIYMAELRRILPDLPIAISSYRYPKYHMDFPWKQFLELADINMPQVYWIQAHNPAVQLQTTVDQFETLYTNIGFSRPIIPTGAAFAEHGWTATIKDIEEFHEESLRLASKNKILASNNWWELSAAIKHAFVDTIAAQSWSTPPPGEPEPPTVPDVPRVLQVVNGKGINVRSQANVTSANIIGFLRFGAKPIAYEFQKIGNNLWARIGDNLWIAATYNGQQLAK